MFYSMGEVSEMFDVNPSLIRHWESKFDCLRPHKNKKGNRMFSPSDVEKLKQIYHLVKERGMTLEGANKAMKGSRGGVSRDTELLERLQRIRAALEEVREELRDGSQEEFVEMDADSVAAEPVDEAAASNMEAASQEESLPGPDMIEENEVRNAAGDDENNDKDDDRPEDGSDAASEKSEEEDMTRREDNVGAVQQTIIDVAQPEPGADTEGGADTSSETAAEQSEGQPAAAGAVSPKSRTRRRKKGEEEDKELFPFYEQSLF